MGLRPHRIMTGGRLARMLTKCLNGYDRHDKGKYY
jgi:hypothetical protein